VEVVGGSSYSLGDNLENLTYAGDYDGIARFTMTGNYHGARPCVRSAACAAEMTASAAVIAASRERTLTPRSRIEPVKVFRTSQIQTSLPLLRRFSWMV
jgi:hypothetical protein